MTPEQIKLRDEILNVKKSDYSYGLAYFENLDLSNLQKLLDNGIITLKYCFNSSPTVEVFFKFLTKYQFFTCFGHVSNRMQDYSTVITGIEAYGVKDKDAIIDFCIQFRKADEFDATEKHCRAWYD